MQSFPICFSIFTEFKVHFMFVSIQSGLQYKEPILFEDLQTLIYSFSAQSLSSKEADETAKERKNCSEGIWRLTLLLLRQGEASFLLFVFLTPSVWHVIANFIIHNALRACSIVVRVIGIMQVSVCSGSHSHSGIPGLPFRLFCPQEQNSWKIFRNKFLFQNIPNVWVINLKIAQHLTE